MTQAELDVWGDELKRDKRGTIRATVANARVILERHPAVAGMLAFDERANCPVFVRRPPWTDPEDDRLPRPVRDVDVLRLVTWCDRLRGDDALEDGVTMPKDVWADAILLVAKESPIDHVREYLSGLSGRWDGQRRIDDLFPRYFGAEPTRYVRAIGRAFLIGAVARAFRPGCKVDALPILEGAQGAGKSTAWRILAGERGFADDLPDLTSKDAPLQLQGPWIIELAELDALSRSDVARMKAFLTRSVDRFRAPYARAPEDHPRRCVFVGTTNDDQYLRDGTGNRRYWPIRCGRIDLEALRRDRDQLWAEALVGFKAGDAWHLEGELVAEAATEQEERRQRDPWESIVADYVVGRSRITTFEILRDAIEKPAGQQTRADEMRVGEVLRGLGFRKRRVRDGGRLIVAYEPGHLRAVPTCADVHTTNDEGVNVESPFIPSVVHSVHTFHTHEEERGGETKGSAGGFNELRVNGVIGVNGVNADHLPPTGTDDEGWI